MKVNGVVSDTVLGERQALLDVDTSVRLRYSCKKFKRHDELDGNQEILKAASKSNPDVVQKAVECLDVARLSPNSFNMQPYKILVVHTPEKKLALSKCALGPNQQRILDSDCTAVFLADKQTCRTFGQMTDFMISTSKPDRIPGPDRLKFVKIGVSVFSSGFPLPRILASPLSLLLRSTVSVLDFFFGRFAVIPTLSNAETWATKQTMPVAMTYMLCCTSRGLATAAMEGFNAASIRKQLNIPARYAIPVIVSTGVPFSTHPVDGMASRRYPKDDMIYGDTFGKEMKLDVASSERNQTDIGVKKYS